MPSIKIRNLTSATEPEVVSGNFIAAALDENAGLTKSTRKVTFAQVVAGGLKDGVVPIPIESLPVATNNSLGVVQIGGNLSITPQGLLSVDLATLLPSLPIATINSPGMVQVGANLSITPEGILSADNPTTPYQLPTASQTVLGGVKVGNNLTIDPDGTLNANASSGGTLYAFSSGIITNEGQHTITYPAGWTGGTPDKIIVSTRYPAGDAISTVYFQLVSFTSTTVTVFAQAGAPAFATHFCDVLLVKN